MERLPPGCRKIPCQSLFFGVEALLMKVMLSLTIPSAISTPETVSEQRFHDWPVAIALTTTPGSIVKVSPKGTVTLPVMIYGLFALSQVVLPVRAPLTVMDAYTADDCRVSWLP